MIIVKSGNTKVAEYPSWREFILNFERGLHTQGYQDYTYINTANNEYVSHFEVAQEIKRYRNA